MAIQALNSILVEIREAIPCHTYDDFKGLIWSHTLLRQWYWDIKSPRVGLVATKRMNQAVSNYMWHVHPEPESDYLLRYPQFLASVTPASLITVGLTQSNHPTRVLGSLWHSWTKS